MRQAVGVQRHHHPGDDRKQAEPDPGQDQGAQPREGDGLGVALALGQDVDDAAEQDGLGEGRDGEAHIGEGEERPELQVGAELSEDADVETDEPHRRSGSRPALGGMRSHARRAVPRGDFPHRPGPDPGAARSPRQCQQVSPSLPPSYVSR